MEATVENEARSEGVLESVSEAMAKQILCDLLSVQATRARMLLDKERRDGQQLQRVLAVGGVISILLHVWL